MVIPLWKTIMSAEETNERRVFSPTKTISFSAPIVGGKRKGNRHNNKTKNTLQTLGVAFHALVSCDINGEAKETCRQQAKALKFIKN